jgi:hypothetical protein
LYDFVNHLFLSLRSKPLQILVLSILFCSRSRPLGAQDGLAASVPFDKMSLRSKPPTRADLPKNLVLLLPPDSARRRLRPAYRAFLSLRSKPLQILVLSILFCSRSRPLGAQDGLAASVPFDKMSLRSKLEPFCGRLSPQVKS